MTFGELKSRFTSRRAGRRVGPYKLEIVETKWATAEIFRPLPQNVLVPRPRLHLIRYHGVLAPIAKLRARVVPQGPEVAGPATEAAGAASEAEPVLARSHRISCTRLLKRVFDIDVRHCPRCGAGELEIIAAILERPVIEKILGHLGLDPQPPPKGRAREAGLHFVA